MQGTERDTRFTIRLLDALEKVEYWSALVGESRSEFIREAVRERAERLERNHNTGES